MSKAVKEIVACWLKDNGYDGLYNNDGDCACTIDDLAPCGELSQDCYAGYKIDCASCAKKDHCEANQDCYEADWIIAAEKDFCQPEYVKETE